MQSKSITPEYFDLKALAAYSSIPVRTIRDYLSDADNPIPCFALKRKIFVRKSEFDSWMQTHRHDSGKLDAIVDEVLRDFKA